jgi:FkbM family methyltransferase
MHNFAERFYSRFKSPHTVGEFFGLIDELGIKIRWGIEAGCHDGSDTKEMIEVHGVEIVYAFEPDASARLMAEHNLAEYIGGQVELSSLALMDKPGLVEINYLGLPGSGSTQVRSTLTQNEEPVQAIRLDDFPITRESEGFLWLDVEGVGAEVLSGSLETLKKISVIKCEVEFHDMSHSRKSNFRKVFDLLTNSGFVIWKCDINPGYFGDVFFVRKKHLTQTQILKTKLVFLLVLLIRSCIYPWLGKPQDFKLKKSQ